MDTKKDTVKRFMYLEAKLKKQKEHLNQKLQSNVTKLCNQIEKMQSLVDSKILLLEAKIPTVPRVVRKEIKPN
jgi:hypothetical protein